MLGWNLVGYRPSKLESESDSSGGATDSGSSADGSPLCESQGLSSKGSISGIVGPTNSLMGSRRFQ